MEQAHLVKYVSSSIHYWRFIGTLCDQCCNTCEDVQRAYTFRRWNIPSLHTIEQVRSHLC